MKLHLDAKFPPFVAVGSENGSCLRLVEIERDGSAYYWRDAGRYSLKVRRVFGSFRVVEHYPEVAHLIGVRLLEVSHAVWERCNVGHVPYSLRSVIARY